MPLFVISQNFLRRRSFMPSVGIIDRIFNWSRVRHAQLMAPVLAEREQYLAYLLENGVSRPSVRSTACTLMHSGETLGPSFDAGSSHL